MRRSKGAIASLTGAALQPLPLLAIFLALVFFTGGSSWPYEIQLSVLRPVAAIIAAWGLATMRREHWASYWQVWSLFGSAFLLTALHLVPLPYEVWSNLPGRQLIVDIDAAGGLGKIWRPLSMQPDATMNALLSLIVPFAALTLAVQLDERERRRLIAIVIFLAAVSAFVGFLQLSGVNISLYDKGAEIHPSGLFNNRNHQAALLAIAIPLAAVAFRGGFGWTAETRGGKVLAVGLIACLLPLLIVTGSRSGVVLAGISMVITTSLIFFAGQSDRGRIRRIFYFLAAVAFVAAFAVAASFLARDISFQRLASGEEDLRYVFWQSTIAMLPSYWPWGTGVGTYAPAYQILEPDALLRPDFTNHAHNEFLEIAFTVGIPGLVVLAAGLLFVFTHLVQVFRASRGSMPGKDVAIAGLTVMILIAVASVTDYPARTPTMLTLLAIGAVWTSGRAGFAREN